MSDLFHPISRPTEAQARSVSAMDAEILRLRALVKTVTEVRDGMAAADWNPKTDTPWAVDRLTVALKGVKP